MSSTEELFASREYHGTPFKIESYKIDNGAGYWGYKKVKIYKNNEYFGEYIRNYSDMELKTFAPFQLDGEWYALYSKHYTATRVARLETHFEDWCGQDKDAYGFCPTEFFVPVKFTTTYKRNDGSDYNLSHWLDSEYENEEEFWIEAELSPVTWANFAFLSGCVWGDDNSWKLRYIDLSEIKNKNLIIKSKFGYWELPSNHNIRQCIRMVFDTRIRLLREVNIDLKEEMPVDEDQYEEDFADPDKV